MSESTESLSSQTLAELSEMKWNFDNSYARLPRVMFESAQAVRFPVPRLVVLDKALAAELGLALESSTYETLARIFAGQLIPPGAEPIAQAYAGHQFGGFTMLGDGRALLLGEQLTPDGQRFDLQFKGSGPTPYSRRGDGRAALGPMLREYIISRAMHGLGIPTTRSLAVVTTGHPVYRERTLRGAVLTRVAASHIRVGTFQYVAAQRDAELLQQFTDYVIARHDQDIIDSGLSGRERYCEFYRRVCLRQAALIARWQLVGFVHGVMNTDNMAISGETIDYGPCAFLDQYHVDTVFSSIDEQGRYAYGNQPAIGQWNLARLAECLISLFHSDVDQGVEFAKGVLKEYLERLQQHWMDGMRAKLGLKETRDEDQALFQELLEWMQESRADWTNTFDDFSTLTVFESETYRQPRVQAWIGSWLERLSAEGISLSDAQTRMQRVNPWVIARNHRVEEALAAAEKDDLQPLNALVAALDRPFDRDPALNPFRQGPPANQCGYRTFCGT